MWILYALLAALFGALVAIFAKLGLQDIDSTLATSIRAVIMALFLIVVVVVSGKINLNELSSIKTKDWILIALSAIAGALSWLFYFLALKIGDASKVAPLDRLSMVFVVVFALLLLGEKIKLAGIIGVVLMTLGAVLISV